MEAKRRTVANKTIDPTVPLIHSKRLLRQQPVSYDLSNNGLLLCRASIFAFWPRMHDCTNMNALVLQRRVFWHNRIQDVATIVFAMQKCTFSTEKLAHPPMRNGNERTRKKLRDSIRWRKRSFQPDGSHANDESGHC